MASRHSGTRWKTWLAMTAPKRSSGNGSCVQSAWPIGTRPPLSAMARSIGRDRSMPTTSSPTSASGKAMRPVPTPISSTGPWPMSASASTAVTCAAASGDSERVAS